jgi:hypothetical protein
MEKLTPSARLEAFSDEELSELLGLDQGDEPSCARCGGEISEGECVECGELAG